MKNMIKTKPSKTEKTMMNMFDKMVVDYMKTASKFGAYSPVATAEKNQTVGVLRCLRLTKVINDELWENCLDAIFSIREG
ncbi:MAG: hypothetical protein J6V44_15070 [Methanobrevibacter sp.]|nr:hypothetical protein [Methanobrevibacter sp.]MBO7696551.1 hypothetical protein [Methanobrevibacter sp.]